MDSTDRFWLVFWGIVAAALVGIFITIAVGLHHAQVNATEQMRVCVEAGMSFIDQDGNGTCIK